MAKATGDGVSEPNTPAKAQKNNTIKTPSPRKNGPQTPNSKKRAAETDEDGDEDSVKTPSKRVKQEKSECDGDGKEYA